MTRRRRGATVLVVVAASLYGYRGSATEMSVRERGLLDVDYRALVARADLDYNEPARRSEEGMPLGNGRMGSLVWTVPAALRLQINRVDVFGSNCATNSFPERNTDYCGGLCLRRYRVRRLRGRCLR